MDMALYTIYIGGTAAPSQGPNFHTLNKLNIKIYLVKKR